MGQAIRTREPSCDAFWFIEVDLLPVASIHILLLYFQNINYRSHFLFSSLIHILSLNVFNLWSLRVTLLIKCSIYVSVIVSMGYICANTEDRRKGKRIFKNMLRAISMRLWASTIYQVQNLAKSNLGTNDVARFINCDIIISIHLEL